MNIMNHYPARRKAGAHPSMSAACSLLLLAAATTRADVITDWNTIAVPLIRTAPNITATRQLALVHIAQFEAVNAVAGKYAPYVVNIAIPGASPEATAACPMNELAVEEARGTSLEVG